MTTQLLERPTKQRDLGRGATMRRDDDDTAADPPLNVLPADFDLDAELSMLGTSSEIITDRDELGQRIMQSAMSPERDSFAIRCRSVHDATRFATPMRSTLLTMSSGFGGISATISPSLTLNTWPAMDALVASLEQSGAGEIWQPIGERSVSVGAARHIFVSVDNPIRDDATTVIPNVVVEVVGAHIIDPEWFDRVVAPRCQDKALTFVFYGQSGFAGSLFERAEDESRFRGSI